MEENYAVCKEDTESTKMLLYSVDKPNRTFSERYVKFPQTI